MNVKVGVALFDEPSKPKTGVSCFDGEVKQFENIGELDSTVVWVTNVSYFAYKENALYRYPNLRRDQYLRLSLTQIMRELNISNSPTGIQKLGSIISEAAQSIVELFGVNPNTSKYQLTQGGHNQFLSQEQLSLPLSAEVQSKVALEESYHSFQGAMKIPGSNAKIRTYTFPRQAHCEYLLSQPFPVDNDWSELNFSGGSIHAGVRKGEVLPNTEKTIAGLKNLHKTTAALLNVHVKSIEPKYAQGFTFGNLGANSKARVWASLPEVIDMLRYAEVEIIKGLQTTNEKIGLMNINSADSRYSYVKGIVSENVWTALAEKVELTGKNTHQTGVGVYLRAYDRILCGKLAEAFMKERYHLAGFGVGLVKVWCTPVSSNIKKLDEIAKAFGAKPDLGASA